MYKETAYDRIKRGWNPSKNCYYITDRSDAIRWVDAYRNAGPTQKRIMGRALDDLIEVLEKRYDKKGGW